MDNILMKWRRNLLQQHNASHALTRDEIIKGTFCARSSMCGSKGSEPFLGVERKSQIQERVRIPANLRDIADGESNCSS
jgi:hypothetical protein